MKKPLSQRLHKWLGIPLCFLLFMSALSGILTNHRDILQNTNIPRWLLPESYTVKNWNNAAARGIISSGGQHYIYGSAGVWLTSDSTFRAEPHSYQDGIEEGADHRRILSMAVDARGEVWLTSQYALYKEKPNHSGWQIQPNPEGLNERLSDMQIKGDTIVLMSRSHIYTRTLDNPQWIKHELLRADKHTEGSLLFSLVWVLHNGEYFGTIGKLAVDAVGLFVMLLSATGLALTITGGRLRKKRSEPLPKEQRQSLMKLFALQMKIHNGWGSKLFWVLLYVFITGWFLRPPAMLTLLYHRLTPWKISHIYSDNPWHDRLRTLRYDNKEEKWVIYTSTGFYTLRAWNEQPKVWQLQPKVSPMGINLMEQRSNGEWLVGSFSGLFVANMQEPSIVRNYFTGKVVGNEHASPFGATPIAGGRVGANVTEDRLFAYDLGAIKYDKASENSVKQITFAAEPKALTESPFSLWQWALEVHTGRIYIPILGKMGSEIYIFPFGLVALTVLITGYLRMRKRKKN